MSTIITIANQKGGVGKTAICVNLAHAFKENITTAIIDLDPQGSAIQSKSKMRDVDVLPYTGDLNSLDYQAIIVDTPPYFHENMLDVLSISNLVIIPVRAGVWDVLATENTINLIKSIQEKNETLKVVLLLNMVNPSTTLTEEVEGALKKFGIPILKTKITERVCFGRSASFPDGIYSMADKKAVNELNALTKEILFLLRK